MAANPTRPTVLPPPLLPTFNPPEELGEFLRIFLGYRCRYAAQNDEEGCQVSTDHGLTPTTLEDVLFRSGRGGRKVRSDAPPQSLLIPSRSGEKSFVYLASDSPPPPLVPLTKGHGREGLRSSWVMSSLKAIPKQFLSNSEEWELFFSALPEEALGFLASCCTVVVQSSAQEGYLHLFGRSLSGLVVTERRRWRKRATPWMSQSCSSRGDCPPPRVRRVEREGGDNEFGVNVRRMMLTDTGALDNATIGMAASSSKGERENRRPSANEYIRWCTRRGTPSSIPVVASRRPTENHCVSYIPSFPLVSKAQEENLTQMLHTLWLQCLEKVNYRGQAIRVFGEKERKFKELLAQVAKSADCPSATEEVSSEKKGKSVPVVTTVPRIPVQEYLCNWGEIQRYVEGCLLELDHFFFQSVTKRAAEEEATGAKKQKKKKKQKPQEASESSNKPLALWGTRENLKAFVDAVVRCLRCGDNQQIVFPRREFLRGVKVSLVPWLKEQCGSRHRSLILQRLYLHFAVFLAEVVVPVMLRRCLHVTWSPKQRSVFVFIPHTIWAPMRELEMRRLREHCMELRPLRGPREIWLRAHRSPTRLTLQVSKIQLLPDRKKLRPIAKAQVVSAAALASIATRRPLLDSQEGKKPPPRRGTALRMCLRVLTAGLRVRNRRLGKPWPLLNRSHADEYPQWLAFNRQVLAACHHQQKQQVAADCSNKTKALYLLHGDASRCYDMLPQDAVVSLVDNIVCEETYYLVTFEGIAPSHHHYRQPQPPQQGTAPPSAVLLFHRQWFCALSATEYQRGEVSGIPAGWIVEQQSVNTISGAQVRSLLRQHLSEHLVLLNGKLYVQTRGITQGSTVASLICDTMLEDGVDACLRDILEETCGATSACCQLRRLDDVLVATTSIDSARGCYAALSRGWPEVGYVPNREKLEVVPPLTDDCQQEATTVSWCGMLIGVASDEERQDGHALSFSIDWNRLRHLDIGVMQTSPLYYGCETDLVVGSLRLFRSLRCRVVVPLLCGTLNSQRRGAQTILELGLFWCMALLAKIIDTPLGSYRPHPRVILRPMAVVISSLEHYLQRIGEECRQQGSSRCAVEPSAAKHLWWLAMDWALRASLSSFTPRCPTGRRPNQEDQVLAGGSQGKRLSRRWFFIMLAIAERKKQRLGRETLLEDCSTNVILARAADSIRCLLEPADCDRVS